MAIIFCVADNAPEHAIVFVEDNRVYWYHTPPDLKPIENLWHKLQVRFMHACVYHFN